MVEKSPPEQRRFGVITVQLVQADIASLKADALVNAANTQLHMGGGVAVTVAVRDADEYQAALACFRGFSNRAARKKEEASLASDFLNEILKKRNP
jgi:O-acetyl-ADP-ribose deacetylase (regulator of RNase III)